MYSYPGDSAIKKLSTMQEMWVLSLGGEDPLEKEMATHSSVLAWRSTVHGAAKSQTQSDPD